MQHSFRVSTSRALQLGALAALIVACAEAAPTDPGAGGAGGSGGTTPSNGGSGTSGASATGGTLAAGGTTSGNGGSTSDAGGASATGGAVSGSGGSAAGTGGASGSATTGGASSGGASNAGASSGGVSNAGSSTGGSTNGGTGTGGDTSGGRGGRQGGGGMAGTAGNGVAGSGTAGTGTAGTSSMPPMGDNSVAYIGCSMAYNIGTGYKRVGGKVMWNSDSYQTSAMVVQNWTSSSSSSWNLFDQKMSSIGGKEKVKAVMVQICIFSSRATDDEVKQMVAAAKAHTNPGTHIYLVGQPQYEAGHECSLAGNGGAKWTDDEAKKIAADTSVNQDVSYLGTFIIDSTKGQVSSDSCHATSSGEDELGRQAMKFFGG